MAQNIYDAAGFFAAYSQLGRSLQGLEGAAEWPAIRALLPDLAGKQVVDLGCGFGWFARWARQQGAADVTALDLSENMLARARTETSDPAIAYAKADLDRLALPGTAFDLAYSSLAFHYVADFDRLVRTVYQALRPGGDFVFTIEHPIFMAARRPDWIATAGTHPGSAEDNGSHKSWPVDQYAVEGPRVTDWLAKGVVKYHRTIGTTVNSLIAAGFTLKHLDEWHPTAAQIAALPALAEEMERPMFLLVSAQR